MFVVLEDARKHLVQDAPTRSCEVNKESPPVGWMWTAFDVVVAFESVEDAGEGRGRDR